MAQYVKQGIQKDGIISGGRQKRHLQGNWAPKLLQAHLWLPYIINILCLLAPSTSCRSLITQKQSYKPPALCVCTSIILFMSPDYQGNKQRAFLWSGIFFLKWNIKALISIGRKKSTICLSLFLTLLITHIPFELLTIGSTRNIIFQSVQKCPSMSENKNNFLSQTTASPNCRKC